jgi:hypothetical protein
MLGSASPAGVKHCFWRAAPSQSNRPKAALLLVEMAGRLRGLGRSSGFVAAIVYSNSRRPGPGNSDTQESHNGYS